MIPMTNSYCVRSFGAFALVLVAAALCPAYGQTQNSERRTVTAARLAPGERITLDGRFDEPVWIRAMPAADFIQVDPSNGRQATEPTEVRIAYDQDAIYLGVTCFDSEPDRLACQIRQAGLPFPGDSLANVVQVNAVAVVQSETGTRLAVR
jgi:hypothetical protein